MIKTGRVEGNGVLGTRVIPLPLTISNVYLVVGESGVILVDSGDPGNGDRILDMAAKSGVDASDISLILLTHGHVDHFGSAAELKSLTGAPVAIHESDAGQLRLGRNPHLTPVGLEGRLIKLLLKGEANPLDADVVIREGTSLKEWGVAGKVIETPGHTQGSVSVSLESGEVIVGDIVAGGFLGFRLFPGKPRYHLFAEDIGEVRRSIKKVLDLNPTQILPGHGGPLEPDALRRWLR